MSDISTFLAAAKLEHFPQSADAFKEQSIDCAVHNLDLILCRIRGEYVPGCRIDDTSYERVREACSKIWHTLQAATWVADPAGKRVLAARADAGVQAFLAQVAQG